MSNPNERPSVFQQWHREILRPYVHPLHIVIKMLEEVPLFPDYVTAVDERKLLTCAHALGVDISEYDLRDIDDFHKARGDILRVAIEKAEKELKPTNPLEDVLKYIEKESPDLLVEEEGEEDGTESIL